METQRKFVSKIDSVVSANTNRIFNSAQYIYDNANYLLNIFKAPAYKNKVLDAKFSYDKFINNLNIIIRESDEIMFRADVGFNGFDRNNNFPINDSEALKGLEKEKKRLETMKNNISEGNFLDIIDLYKSDRINKTVKEIKNNIKDLNTYFTQCINVVKRNAASKRK